VFAFKCWVTGSRFQIYGKPSGGATARLGIVVSKRIMPRAVDRNYCKRLVREIFWQESMGLRGFDFVVRPRMKVAFHQASGVRSELHELLQHLLRKCHGRRTATVSDSYG
jgi:ribonuclease P protein component